MEVILWILLALSILINFMILMGSREKIKQLDTDINNLRQVEKELHEILLSTEKELGDLEKKVQKETIMRSAKKKPWRPKKVK